MATVQLKESGLVWRIEQVARQTAQPVEKVLETAVESYLDALEKVSIHAETEAFWAMRDALLAKYPGEHVAIHQGQLVDHDADVSRLNQRVRQRFGQLPVLITPLTNPPGEIVWRGGRLDHKERING